MPIDSHLPQADPFSLVPTFKRTVWLTPECNTIALKSHNSEKIRNGKGDRKVSLAKTFFPLFIKKTVFADAKSMQK
jgi:hypothetical protein